MSEQMLTSLTSPYAMPSVCRDGVKLATTGYWSSGNIFFGVMNHISPSGSLNATYRSDCVWWTGDGSLASSSSDCLLNATENEHILASLVRLACLCQRLCEGPWLFEYDCEVYFLRSFVWRNSLDPFHGRYFSLSMQEKHQCDQVHKQWLHSIKCPSKPCQGVSVHNTRALEAA